MKRDEKGNEMKTSEQHLRSKPKTKFRSSKVEAEVSKFQSLRIDVKV